MSNWWSSVVKGMLAKTKVLFICIGTICLISHMNFLRSSWSKSIHKETLMLELLNRDISTKEKSAIIETETGQTQQGCALTAARIVYNCSVINFLAAIDPTAKNYNSDQVCDESSKRYDIICRLYLTQIGLEHLEETICTLENVHRVPKVVYYVIFGIYQFKFSHFVSITAAKRFISPTAIYVIGDQHPTGKWWQETLSSVHGVRFLYRELPATISGLTPPRPHHLSDIVRLQVIYMNGGIYLDADMIIIRDLEPLLDYDISLGLIDNRTGMGNAFIMAKRGNSFIREWYAEYHRYRHNLTDYFWNSLKVPQDMYYKNTSRVHLVSDKLYRPNWFESQLLFNRSDYPWRTNYGVHIWGAKNLAPESQAEIDTANSTIAQIFRYVLYGDHRMRQP